MQPASRAITCNQVLTKCLQLVFFGKPVPGVQISGTARRDVSRGRREEEFLFPSSPARFLFSVYDTKKLLKRVRDRARVVCNKGMEES